jgi:hypothetical protein
MSAACPRQTPASMASLATRQGFALTATTGRLRGSCEIVTVPDPLICAPQLLGALGPLAAPIEGLFVSRAVPGFLRSWGRTGP